MISLASLSSGSAGNSTIIQFNDELILIDCGLSFKRLKERMAVLELDPANLSGIFITHEHSDHISGARVAADKLGIPVYSNQNTGAVMIRKKRAAAEMIYFENGSEIQHGNFRVEPFSIPHDGVDTVAYNIFCGDKKISVATDFGYPSQMVKQKLKDSDILLLECNHDVKMLQECSKRPWKTKQRILSRHGHLSNEASMEVLTDVLHSGLSQLILGHVSRDTNDYGLVEDIAAKHLEECGFGHLPMHVAQQDSVSPLYTL
ncbi:MAG: MBL fold metallo-hydrolase [Lentisphaeraceae bacterium]|nr:MBL fold metallo-hydrolase [Lentisphaeraceae bacterium]